MTKLPKIANHRITTLSTPNLRIAKAISNKGFCSRRDAEKLILDGKVFVNGKKITEVVCFVSENDVIKIDQKELPQKFISKAWIYYKPVGVITTHKDPLQRQTVFSALNINILSNKAGQHIISVGRLDQNSEGLLLLTNDKAFAHKMQSPDGGFKRVYRVRVYSPKAIDLEKIGAEIQDGVNINGFKYKPINFKVEKNINISKNTWVELTLTEGKNREIRNILTFFGLKINRLIRIAYGPYVLGNLKPSETKEVHLI